jgi:hypothetical protein
LSPRGRLKLSPGADGRSGHRNLNAPIGRRTLDSATGAASRQVGGPPRKCRMGYLPRPCTGGTSVRRRLDAQPYASLPMPSTANLGPSIEVCRDRRCSSGRVRSEPQDFCSYPSPVLTSIRHSCWQLAHRTVRWMRSGRLTSVPARKGAPGLRPHEGQERACAEWDGRGSPCGGL